VNKEAFVITILSHGNREAFVITMLDHGNREVLAIGRLLIQLNPESDMLCCFEDAAQVKTY
jgi:hypothetical protein